MNRLQRDDRALCAGGGEPTIGLFFCSSILSVAQFEGPLLDEQNMAPPSKQIVMFPLEGACAAWSDRKRGNSPRTRIFSSCQTRRSPAWGSKTQETKMGCRNVPRVRVGIANGVATNRKAQARQTWSASASELWGGQHARSRSRQTSPLSERNSSSRSSRA